MKAGKDEKKKTIVQTNKFKKKKKSKYEQKQSRR